MSEVRDSGPECQAATVQERPGGATLRPRSGAVAERSYPESEVSGSQEEIPFTQVKEQRLRFAGAAVKRYPTSKVRETQVRW